MNENVKMEEFILVKHWWSLALRGLFALLFGVLALVWPEITIGLLVILFGAFAFADGFLAIIAALCYAKRWHRGVLFLQGLVGIVVGIIVFFWPAITAIVLLFLIAIWALVTGFFEIIAAFRLPVGTGGKWLLGLSGLLSVVIGLILVSRPGAGLLVIIWLIGIYAILAGVTLFILAFMLKGMQKRT